MTEAAAREGDAEAMVALGRMLLASGGIDCHAKGAWWITRAAELGLPEAQIRLADLMAAENAWTRFGIGRNRDEAAWWLATALASATSPADTVIAVKTAERHGLPLPPPGEVTVSIERRMEGQGWSVVQSAPPEPLPLLPVAELLFDDLFRFGGTAMLTLLRHTDKDDWVWALAPGGTEATSRLRHFVFGCMAERAARLMMRDMLAVDTDMHALRALDAKNPILDTLRDLCDDGLVTVPDGLVTDLWERQNAMVAPSDGGPYDFAGHRKDFAAAHKRLARRPVRGEPTPPPVMPTPGWYADHLSDQPNATIRAVLAGTGERDLCCYLSGCSPFTRFRFWQVSPVMVRARLTDADEQFRIGEKDRVVGRVAMDVVLAEWHRAGRIRWWTASE